MFPTTACNDCEIIAERGSTPWRMIGEAAPNVEEVLFHAIVSSSNATIHIETAYLMPFDAPVPGRCKVVLTCHRNLSKVS